MRVKEESSMDFAEYFPIWDKLSDSEQALLSSQATLRKAPQGALLHNGAADCVGLFLIRSGQLRAFIVSESEGKEVTIYRLFERDMCLFSASCIMNSIQFDISIEAERDCEFWVIPSNIYKGLMETSAAVANYTNKLMATRFSEVMWLVEQIMWKSFDKRLAAFLLEESAIEESVSVKMTHERIAAHLGTAREVVTRMLRYFSSEGMVRLTRGCIEITDEKRLAKLSKQ